MAVTVGIARADRIIPLSLIEKRDAPLLSVTFGLVGWGKIPGSDGAFGRNVTTLPERFESDTILPTTADPSPTLTVTPSRCSLPTSISARPTNSRLLSVANATSQ